MEPYFTLTFQCSSFFLFYLDLALEEEASQSSVFEKLEPEKFNASYAIDDKNT